MGTVAALLPALDAVEALPGLCRLERRSGSLDGSLPMRAAQHCTPVVLGSAAGFQVVFEHPIALRGGRRRVAVILTPHVADAVVRQLPAALDRMIDHGWLAAGSLWHRIFRDDVFAIRNGRLLLWTGWLVRPGDGVVLLVSGAYNRRSPVTARDHVVTDTEQFTPLVLEIDLQSLAGRTVRLDAEVGCLTPLCPAVRFTMQPLIAAADVGASAIRFYDASYLAEKERRPTGRYRKLHTALASGGPTRAACRVAYAGPRVHRIAARWRRAGPEGFDTWSGASGVVLQQAIVGCECPLTARWDGRSLAGVRSQSPESRRRFGRLWRRVYGEESAAALEFFEQYFMALLPDEPYFMIQPWVFVETPAGWSSIVDGCHGPGFDGMRGVIATDVFGTVSMVYRLYRPTRIRVRRGAPLLRVLPVPRELLHRPLRRLDPDGRPSA